MFRTKALQMWSMTAFVALSLVVITVYVVIQKSDDSPIAEKSQLTPVDTDSEGPSLSDDFTRPASTAPENNLTILAFPKNYVLQKLGLPLFHVELGYRGMEDLNGLLTLPNHHYVLTKGYYVQRIIPLRDINGRTAGAIPEISGGLENILTGKDYIISIQGDGLTASDHRLLTALKSQKMILAMLPSNRSEPLRLSDVRILAMFGPDNDYAWLFEPSFTRRPVIIFEFE